MTGYRVNEATGWTIDRETRRPQGSAGLPRPCEAMPRTLRRGGGYPVLPPRSPRSQREVSGVGGGGREPSRQAREDRKEKRATRGAFVPGPPCSLHEHLPWLGGGASISPLCVLGALCARLSPGGRGSKKFRAENAGHAGKRGDPAFLFFRRELRDPSAKPSPVGWGRRILAPSSQSPQRKKVSKRVLHSSSFLLPAGGDSCHDRAGVVHCLT